MLRENSRLTTNILGSDIDVLSWRLTLDMIADWAKAGKSSYVCICNVHSLVTAKRNPEFRRVINQADMATPDGMPLAWYMRWHGYHAQQRINGPDLMWKFCDLAADLNIPIFLFGATPETLERLVSNLKNTYPKLQIAGFYAPPFRQLTYEEDERIIAMINKSRAKVVFAGFGCPKQEYWMAQHKGKINAVMIGVGAAFDYHAGIIKRAPLWMQRSGLEWMYRLLAEPRRLWRRYFVTNSLFVFYMLEQFLRLKKIEE